MSAQQRRPRRQKKGDSLICPGASKAQIECDFGMAPFGRLAEQMDIKWGIDRLPELVTPALAQKYGAAIAHLNECIQEADPAKCTAAAENCIRGMNAMNAEATANGATPANGEFWEYELPDDAEPFRFAIMRDGAEWMTTKAQRPELRLFTMREVAIALHAYCSAFPVGEVKDAFPGAEITKITARPKSSIDWKVGDPIPF